MDKYSIVFKFVDPLQEQGVSMGPFVHVIDALTLAPALQVFERPLWDGDKWQAGPVASDVLAFMNGQYDGNITDDDVIAIRRALRVIEGTNRELMGQLLSVARFLHLSMDVSGSGKFPAIESELKTKLGDIISGLEVSVGVFDEMEA